MKLIGALPLGAAALAKALVAPASDQAPLAGGADPSWWDTLPSKDALDQTIDVLGSGLDRAVHVLDDIQAKLQGQLKEAIASAADHDADGAGGHHGSADLTIYQIISLSNYTKKFAKIVDEHPAVVKLLNSTEANYTLFVPVDDAISQLPDDEKPSKELVERVLLYHVGLGQYPARRIIGTHTLPTALDEKFLAGEPQRLRTSVGLTGVKINFYSKVVAADVAAKNGIIHAVNSILIPPPMVGQELSLFPSRFSTLLLAYDKTDFVKYIHGIKMVGSTVFAPSNAAFARLGPKANAFLFNTETGLKYLRALLKYHISPNATLYTDAFYDKTHTQQTGANTWENEHYDLPTLLDDAPVGVDITRLAAFVSVRVNEYAHAPVTDGIAKNGVIHVVDKVLIPPCKHKDGDEYDIVGIDVEDLKSRLDEYVSQT